MDILCGLERNSEILERITIGFGQILAAGHLRVHSFREELDTKGMSIVDASSYSIDYLYETQGSLHASHRTMANMSSFNDIKFQRLTSVIQRAKSKYERYMMFEIVKCCREPFSMYQLLGATLFLTTGRDTYPELQRLSWDQMERRLYSRSAGWLDAPGRCMDGDYPRSPVVQFIHQTVKEYMTTGEGSTIILQDVGIEPQDSGFMFILRYLVYLIATFDKINRDIDAERLATRNLAHYARKVERHGNQSVSKFLEQKWRRDIVL